MSADDPTDDELEREAMRDVPATIGTAAHRPKLSSESRAINPKALLAAEARAQSDERDDEDLVQRPRRLLSSHVDEQQRQLDELEAAGVISREQRNSLGRVASLEARRRAPTLPQMPAVRSPLAEFSRKRDLGTEPPPRAREQPAPPPPSDVGAWDRFVAAALPITTAWGVEQPELAACEVADRLLEERRKRFG